MQLVKPTHHTPYRCVYMGLTLREGNDAYPYGPVDQANHAFSYYSLSYE
jgi:hypothetical protein